MIRALAILLAVAGVVSLFWPGTISGLLFQTVSPSPRESQIIGALFIAGAAILWFIRAPDDK